MRKQMVLWVISSVAVCLALRQPVPKSTVGVNHCLQYLRQASIRFAQSTAQLQKAVAAINADSNTVIAARTELVACRKNYKHIEFFVEYFFEQRIKIFNRPPVYEVEEPFIEYQQPVGMQVIEAALFDEEVIKNKADIKAQADVINLTAENMMSYLYGKEITDAGILEAIRQELIRIYTLGLSGYDAPELKTGIAESYEAMRAIQQVLQPYLNNQKNGTSDNVASYLDTALRLLSANQDFDSFNRLSFYTSAALPLQQQVNSLVKNLGLATTEPTLYNYTAPHLFSPGSLHPVNDDSSVLTTPALVSLGHKLFNETALSGNGLRSCATCHTPEKYFTDGKVKSIAFNGKDRVERNAPSLLYAAYQHNQFLDGRATNLATQMLAVLQSPLEMNALPQAVVQKIRTAPGYLPLFTSAFPAANQDSLITLQNIAAAISSYEQSFPVMTSAFDRYMQGEQTALSGSQQRGFNLFMGKAACGTCHFAPLFNGLLPPTYTTTEVESLGLTQNTNFKKPVADADSGRYRFFPIQFYIGTFKTPSIRNVARTAPYMHNGAFASLRQVIEFYDRGGGKGLGLSAPYQTLSDKPLHLSTNEKKDIIHFLQALTDKQ